MISATSMINWLDLYEKHQIHDTIENMVQRYAEKMHIFPIIGNESFYIPENDYIMMEDLYGWTQMESIGKYSVSSYSYWVEVEAGENKIIVDSFALIPVFDIDDPKQGFHGELKYPYKLKNPEKILPTDYVRIKRGIADTEFVHPKVSKSDYSSDHYYEIITKSRFVNVNNIYILADNKVTFDEITNLKDELVY